MPEPTTPIEVCCSSAPADEPWGLEFEKHLSLLRRQGIITTWYRRDITPGTDWTKAIDTHLGSASVVE